MVFNAIADFDPEDFSLPETSLEGRSDAVSGLVIIFTVEVVPLWYRMIIYIFDEISL